MSKSKISYPCWVLKYSLFTGLDNLHKWQHFIWSGFHTCRARLEVDMDLTLQKFLCWNDNLEFSAVAAAAQLGGWKVGASFQTLYTDTL